MKQKTITKVIRVSDKIKNKVVDKVKEYCETAGYKIIDIDGVRIELDDGWALIRVSNTGPNITARFEGTTEKVRDKLKETFLELIEKFKQELEIK